MGGINRPVLFAALFIGLVGTVQSFINRRKFARVWIGTYVFLLLLSLVDLFGGGWSQIAGAIALLAALYAGLTQFPWTQLAQAVQGKKTPESERAASQRHE